VGSDQIVGASVRPRRSFLFVPGNRPDMFPKALRAKPDIVCVDLEDAVAPPDKEQARAETLAMFQDLSQIADVELLVRINSLRSREGFADVLAILEGPAGPPGLMLPKVKSAEEVRLLDELLTGEGNPLRLQIIIETNEGLEACNEIAAASPRIDALLFGAVDLGAELRVEPTWTPLQYARGRVIHAAASAGVDVLDVPHLDLDDMEGLERECILAAELGMTGKGAIHPKQLPVIERCFTPSVEAIERARRITAAFEQADTGLVVVDGKLIEKPVLRSMRRILAIAERIERRREADTN
jgi:(S)-citramalyl-CoA lyase